MTGAPLDQGFRDPEIARDLAARIRAQSTRPARIMEVCGTHTMAIFRHGIRSLLPKTLTLISGPGCPVCVTDQGDLDAFVEMARMPGVTITSFGDLLRVPSSDSSLARERARGADVRVVGSPAQALSLAQAEPGRTVVFLGVGFETTAPAVAATLLAARDRGVGNFLVFSAHKLVPPALFALFGSGQCRVDGLLLPGHVSVITGLAAFRPFFERFRVPSVVAGFEAGDILGALAMLTDEIESGTPILENAYARAVTENGNPRAREIMNRVFVPKEARWRGLGAIPESGLAIREEFAAHDAARVLGVPGREAPPPAGCRCGEVITGAVTPRECPLFGRACTPSGPVGPCMVSTEGTCAAYFRFGRECCGGNPF
ncbi:MAG: hydrogenase formation protein HypD [Pseudomonadota bacterium]